MRKLMGLLVALGLLAAVFDAGSGERVIKEFTLFGGSNVDSTEQASNWIPIWGASRVVIKTWTTMTAFDKAGADSLFADSLAGFKVLLSDSLIGVNADNFPVCADSVVLPVTVVGDTARFMAGAVPMPINKVLRAPANGSGLITVVFPTRPGGTAEPGRIGEDNALMMKRYMRIRCTPLRRSTALTSEQSTCNGIASGCRVNGLKGFRMKAYVIYHNVQ
jgi:hypothetical protein